MNANNDKSDFFQPLLPLRRLSNFVYCERLFYYQWVENLFQVDANTTEGSALHRRVDDPTLLENEDPSNFQPLRSLELEDSDLGLRGVIDLAEESAEGVTIVEYKRGAASRDDRDVREAKPWDRIQVVAQALLLKAAGYKVKDAFIYYAADRRRVPVPLNVEADVECRRMIAEAKELASSGTCPPPLVDDWRCSYCSAVSFCLPVESNFWNSERTLQGDTPPLRLDTAGRPPMADDDTRQILVVQTPGAAVGRQGGEFKVTLKGQVIRKVPSHQVRAVYLYGPIGMSTQAIHSCLENDVSVSYFSAAGRFLGLLSSLPASGVDARRGQYELFDKQAECLVLAREIVRAKILNQRTLLRRNATGVKDALKALRILARQASEASSTAELLGREGAAAAIYFANFGRMIKSEKLAFDFHGRNRRPPKDPINALLSLGYAVLAKELAGTCWSVGLDPFYGFYHRPRYGRPALALDLMEEFRPLVVDSVVITIVNRNAVVKDDFVQTTRGVMLGDDARKVFWEEWSRRLDTELTHPVFRYRMSYRRMFEIQARQLWRYLRGEASRYVALTTR